jgi:hypothetical protein
VPRTARYIESLQLDSCVEVQINEATAFDKVSFPDLNKPVKNEPTTDLTGKLETSTTTRCAKASNGSDVVNSLAIRNPK